MKPLLVCRAVSAASKVAALILLCAAAAAGAASDLGWSDYQIIMWQPHSAAQNGVLKELGVTAGMVTGNRNDDGIFIDAQIDPFRANGMRWYVENIGTDFYAPYHKYSPGHPVNFQFLEAQKLYRDNPRDRRALTRNPSLSDADWQRRIHDRLVGTVRAHAPYRPLYYSLGDETGIADLAAFWDFDFSDASLRAMRGWLREQYGSLAALNLEWDSRFASWDQVTPMTTRDAMARTDENYAAWADFKAWMDVAFARALRMGTDAVHEADPTALAAIEGGQVPGWGGYDYTRLATAVDAMEIYDNGENIAIARALNPKLVTLTTSFEVGAKENSRIWRELLQGTRGLILWDETSGFVRDDGSLGARGREAESIFGEIRGGLGALLINSKALTDPIAILTSPASMRTEWMLDWKPKGDAWSRRDAAAEYGGNAWRSALTGYARQVRRAGFQPRFLSPELIDQGALRDGQNRILILPHAVALSPTEADEIRSFAAQGGIVIADIEPGRFDQHSRKLAKPFLSDLFAEKKALYLATDAAQPIRRIFESVGLLPEVAVTSEAGGPAGHIEIHRFRNGDVTIVALQRESGSGTSGEPVRLKFPRAAFLYDVRAKKALGMTDSLKLTLDPFEPTILALAEKPLPFPTIAGPEKLRAGESAEFQFAVPGLPPDAVGVLRLDVTDPAGKPVASASGNLLAPGGKASQTLSPAPGDSAGIWKIRVTDALTGQSTPSVLEVSKP